MTTNRLRGSLLRVGQGLLVIAFAAIFTSLALWQWDRAEQHQVLEAELTRIATLDPVPLTSIHLPQISLDGEDANRMVEVSGRYIATFTAASQPQGSYDVALLEVNGASPRAAILVARQLFSSDNERSVIDAEAEILARLLPTQREDRDPKARISGDETSLARIDSAILLDRLRDPSLALYDGYLLLRKEAVDGVRSELRSIPDLIAEPTVPGYYWQHISYVVIWLLMAALTLFLPFYQRRRNRMGP